MLKKLALLFVIVLIVFMGLSLYAVLNLNSLIEKLRPKFEKIASDIAGAPVTFGSLKASIYPSTSITINDIIIKSAAQSGERITLNEIDLSVSLWPLLSQKIQVTKARIKSLDVLLIKKGKKLHIPGVKAAKEGDNKAGQNTDTDEKSAQSKDAGLSIELDSFELMDSKVVLSDLDKGKDYLISELNLKTALQSDGGTMTLPKLSLNCKLLDKVPTTITAADLKYKLNSGEVDVPNLEATLLNAVFHISGGLNSKDKSGKFSVKSDGFELADIKSTLIKSALPDEEKAAKINAFSPSGKLIPVLDVTFNKDGFLSQGTIEVSNVSAIFNDKSISELGGKIDFQAAPHESKASSANLSLIFNGAPIAAKFAAALSGTTVQISELKAQAFGGTADIIANAELSDPLRFQTQLAASGLNIEKIMMALTKSPSSNVIGTITSAKATVSGVAGPGLMNSLAGNANFLVSDGALKNVNVAGDVLRGVKDLPFISGALNTRVPEGYRNAINSVDTEIKTLSATLAIANGGASTKDLQLVNPLFTLDGGGRIGFNNRVDLDSNVRFEREFSQTLVGSIKELSAILDKDKRLTLPVAISGVAPDLSILPDVSKLIERGTKKIIQDKAGELLEGMLDRKGIKSNGLKDLLDF